MSGKIVAEGVALAGQALGGWPVLDFDQLDRYRGRAGGAEHVVLAGLGIARLLLGCAHGLGQLRHQAGAIDCQCIHRAGLDQRFQRALVDLLRIHARAEIGEIPECAAALTGVHDILDRTFADALECAEAVADGFRCGSGLVRIERMELVPRRIDVGRHHGQAQRAPRQAD